MITGRKPFEHTNPDAAVIQKVLSGIRPERPSVGFSDALWALLIQSWREQLESSDPPAERPEIINILKQLQDEERYWDPDNRLLAPPTPIKQQPSGESSISLKFAYMPLTWLPQWRVPLSLLGFQTKLWGTQVCFRRELCEGTCSYRDF